MQKNFENSLIIGLAMTLGVGVSGFVAYAVFLSFDAGRAMFSTNPSRSMEPTLPAGDHIRSQRFNGDARELRRADVIVFQFPDDPTKQFMKRIIGMPGEKVLAKARRIYFSRDEDGSIRWSRFGQLVH